ncbi:MAG: hypothetical protein ABJL54_10655 [Halioglobus sp.]
MKCYQKYWAVFIISLALLSTNPFASADVLELFPVASRTAEDCCPTNGKWEENSSVYLGSVSNSGYSEIRTNIEFNISSLPKRIDSATLTINIGYAGQRWLALHSFEGEGDASLSLFNVENLLASVSLSDSSENRSVVFDVTGEVRELLGRRVHNAGFSFREDPPNDQGYTIMHVSLDNITVAPKLTINTTSNFADGALVVTDEFCSIADGSVFEDPYTRPNFVTIEDGRKVVTESKNGVVVKICNFDGVTNSTGRAVLYDFQSILDFYDFEYPCLTEHGSLATKDWRVVISPTGRAILTCRFSN